MVAVRRRVVKQLRVPGNYGNNDVDLAVIIQVPKRCSTMCCAQTEAGARVCTYVLKGIVFHVLEDGVGLQIMLLRINIGIFTDMGVGAEEVFVTVIVKVHDASSPAAHLVCRLLLEKKKNTSGVIRQQTTKITKQSTQNSL